MKKYKSFRKPYRIKRKKSILRNRFFWLTLLGLIIIGGFFYFFIFSPFFQIKEIKISGHQEIQPHELEKIVQNQITYNWANNFLTSKSIFLVNLKKIKKELFKEFPQIARLNLKRNFPNSLVVKIEERKPLAIFSQKEDYFFIDAEGIIFKKITTKESENQFLEIENLSLEKKVNLGEGALEKEALNQILDIVGEIKETSKILITKIFIVSDRRLNFKTSESWEIYFNPKEEINWQITKLGLILEKEIPLEKRGNLEYIDLRFSRVYYKYK